MRTTTPHLGTDSRAAQRPPPAISSHEQAMLHAQIKRIVHALRPFGVLHRQALEREAGAGMWHGANFEGALRAAVRAGEIDALPFGFYAMPETDRMSQLRPRRHQPPDAVLSPTRH